MGLYIFQHNLLNLHISILVITADLVRTVSIHNITIAVQADCKQDILSATGKIAQFSAKLFAVNPAIQASIASSHKLF